MNARQAERVAERIVSAVGTELTIRGHRIVPTVSIGIALNVTDSTGGSLLRRCRRGAVPRQGRGPIPLAVLR